MARYRVCVHAYVVVEARNAGAAKAKAELAVRRSVEHWYRHDESGRNFADGWEHFGFQAKKAERVPDDE